MLLISLSQLGKYEYTVKASKTADNPSQPGLDEGWFFVGWLLTFQKSKHLSSHFYEHQ